MITASELERELATMARLARRLMPPLNARPTLFHEQKYALIEFADRLLERVRDVAAPDRVFRSPQVDAKLSEVRAGGRTIPIERRVARA